MNEKRLIRIIMHYTHTLLYRKENIGMKGRFFRHLIVGGIGTALYASFVIIFVEWMKLDPTLGAAISVSVIAVYTYIGNRAWVYDTTNKHRETIPKFLIAAVISVFLNSGIMFLVVQVMGWWYIWGVVSSTLVLPPTNFLINYYWAFK